MMWILKQRILLSDPEQSRICTENRLLCRNMNVKSESLLFSVEHIGHVTTTFSSSLLDLDTNILNGTSMSRETVVKLSSSKIRPASKKQICHNGKINLRRKKSSWYNFLVEVNLGLSSNCDHFQNDLWVYCCTCNMWSSITLKDHFHKGGEY